MFQFIDSIADHIIEHYKEQLPDVKVLFPNYRAALFLQKRLAEKMDETYINPEIFSVDKLVNRYCEWVVPERISLTHSLYQTMKELRETEESFAHFYNWGNKLLDDFDLLDKNMVSAEKLFRTIDDLSAIKQQFGDLDDEIIEILEKFWGAAIANKENSNWYENWEQSGALYFAFANKLKREYLAYPGMKYRYLAENLHVLDEWKDCPVIIAGFNRLSKSEEAILRHFKGHADYFWDADKYFYDDRQHIGGKYLRPYISEFGRVNTIGDFRKEKNLNVKVLNVPKSIAQSQVAIERMIDTEWDPQKTMFVLADEKQLLPLLTVIPKQYDKLNISMGWHISESPIATLIDRILELHLEYNKEHKTYPTLMVASLMQHSYLRKLEVDKYPRFEAVKEWTSLEELEKYGPIYEVIFRPLENKIDIFDRFVELVEWLYGAETKIEKEEDEEGVYLKGSGVFLAEVLKYVHQKLYRLRDLFKPLAESVDLRELTYLFRQIFRNTRIPFAGEPLSGMQILGPLEARSLDFDNIVVFDMREGSWPPSFNESTIPHSLKRVYGMPVIDDEIAEYSYYFWSLISKAHNVLLLNPDDTAAFSPKPKSRFLLELEGLKDELTSYEVITIEQELNVAQEEDIIVEKDDEIMAEIVALPHYSASTLLDYSQCSLRFYFSKILNLGEREKFDPEYDAAKFGTVFHNTMEELYEPFAKAENKNAEIITTEIIKQLKKEKSSIIRKKYREEYHAEEYELDKGRHLFYIKELEKYVDNILGYDLKRAPFSVISLEEKFFKDFIYDDETGEKVKIKGFVDRIDKKDGQYYIIDYKTGNVNYSAVAKETEIFEEDNLDSKKRNILQVLFYTYLKQEEGVELKPQLWSVRDVIELVDVDGADLFLKNHSHDYNKDLEKDLGIVKEGFSEKLREIHNMNVPFRKTQNREHCKFCDFKFICNREERK